jgi:hypothetical protein
VLYKKGYPRLRRIKERRRIEGDQRLFRRQQARKLGLWKGLWTKTWRVPVLHRALNECVVGIIENQHQTSGDSICRLGREGGCSFDEWMNLL